jgi:hypothetical protein
MDGFLNRIQNYERLFVSRRWLADSLANGPHVHGDLLFVHDTSLSPDALVMFGNDMRAAGHSSLADEVAAVWDQAALFIVDDAYWIFLPNGRTILWRFGGGHGLLKWSASDFRTEPCPELGQVSGMCAGAIVSAEGTLER